MTTTAIQKYQKYFAYTDVITHVKSRAGKPIYIRDSSGNVLGTAKDGDEITVHHAETYNAKFNVTRHSDGLTGTISENFIAKPIRINKGPTEYLRIQSETLTKSGFDSTLPGNSNVPTKEFRSHETICQSVIDGLRSNWRVSEDITKHLESYFSSSDRSNFIWCDRISMEERRELGKYVGEIIPGILHLGGDWSSQDIIRGTIARCGFPREASYNGIDSYLTNDRNDSTFISSKFGEGARASVFTNIVPNAIRNRSKIFGNEFGLLLDSIGGIGPDELESKRRSKEALYNYGSEVLLDSKVENPIALHRNIKEHISIGSELTYESKTVLDEVAGKCETIVRDKLPASITQYFSRTAAKRLNEDKKSLDDMKSILEQKNFVQVNLNTTKWMKGIVDFKVQTVSDGAFRIDGAKSAIGDIDARQGSLSYFIK